MADWSTRCSCCAARTEGRDSTARLSSGPGLTRRQAPRDDVPCARRGLSLGRVFKRGGTRDEDFHAMDDGGGGGGGPDDDGVSGAESGGQLGGHGRLRS